MPTPDVLQDMIAKKYGEEEAARMEEETEAMAMEAIIEEHVKEVVEKPSAPTRIQIGENYKTMTVGMQFGKNVIDMTVVQARAVALELRKACNRLERRK